MCLYAQLARMMAAEALGFKSLEQLELLLVERVSFIPGKHRLPHQKIFSTNVAAITKVVDSPLSRPEFDQTNRTPRSCNVQPFSSFDVVALVKVESQALLGTELLTAKVAREDGTRCGMQGGHSPLSDYVCKGAPANFDHFPFKKLTVT